MTNCKCVPKNQWAIVLTCPAVGGIVSVIGSFDDQEQAFDYAQSDKQCNSDYHYFITQFFDKEDEDR
jgi:hypothetical protein